MVAERSITKQSGQPVPWASAPLRLGAIEFDPLMLGRFMAPESRSAAMIVPETMAPSAASSPQERLQQMQQAWRTASGNVRQTARLAPAAPLETHAPIISVTALRAQAMTALLQGLTATSVKTEPDEVAPASVQAPRLSLYQAFFRQTQGQSLLAEPVMVALVGGTQEKPLVTIEPPVSAPKARTPLSRQVDQISPLPQSETSWSPVSSMVGLPEAQANKARPEQGVMSVPAPITMPSAAASMVGPTDALPVEPLYRGVLQVVKSSAFRVAKVGQYTWLGLFYCVTDTRSLMCSGLRKICP